MPNAGSKGGVAWLRHRDMNKHFPRKHKTVAAKYHRKDQSKETVVLDQRVEFKVGATEGLEVVQCRVDALKTASYNPPERIEEKRLEVLLTSVKEYGILMPVLIMPDGQIVDGHRRVACARQLGMETVPAIVLPVGSHADNIYVSLNESTRKLPPAEYLHVELSGGKVPARVQQSINWLRKNVGTDALISLRSLRQSPTAIRENVARIINYCGRKGDKRFARQTFEWVMRFGDMRLYVINAMQNHIDPHIIEEAIGKGRRLVTKWGLA